MDGGRGVYLFRLFLWFEPTNYKGYTFYIIQWIICINNKVLKSFLKPMLQKVQFLTKLRDKNIKIIGLNMREQTMIIKLWAVAKPWRAPAQYNPWNRAVVEMYNFGAEWLCLWFQVRTNSSFQETECREYCFSLFPLYYLCSTEITNGLKWADQIFTFHNITHMATHLLSSNI